MYGAEPKRRRPFVKRFGSDPAGDLGPSQNGKMKQNSVLCDTRLSITEP